MTLPTFKTSITTLLKRGLASNRLRIRQLPLVAIVGIVAVFVSGSALAAHAMASRDNAESAHTATATVAAAKLPQATQLNAATKEGLDTTSKPQPTPSPIQPSQNPTTQNTISQSTVQPVIKYKNDPDPRSTAYSLTPPAPNPKSFDITITHNGQVAPGTEISYNATKNDKTYYAGDYRLSTTTLIIHKSTALVSDIFTVSTPDGAIAEEPALPWYVNNDSYWPQTSSPDGPGSSWNMSIGISGATPLGTYQVHLTSFRTGGGADAWEYDGFMTLIVEN